jgi:hypothetical protein
MPLLTVKAGRPTANPFAAGAHWFLSASGCQMILTATGVPVAAVAA